MLFVKKKSYKVSQSNGVPLFIGDSHALRLMEGAVDIDIPFLGGAACAGYLFSTDFFFIKENNFYFKDHVKPRNPKVCKELMHLLSHEGPIISTVGFNVHTFVKDNFTNVTLDSKSCPEKQFVSQAFFESLVLEKRKCAIEFYTMLHKHQKKFYFLSSPRVSFFESSEVYLRFEEHLSNILTELGGVRIDLEALNLFNKDGTLLEKYRKSNNDEIHGNELFGSTILSSIIASS
ncbi:MAG: hypothetical protein ACI8ZM_005546 [Crocinitomix sp.]|jgi:hypothetical protein